FELVPTAGSLRCGSPHATNASVTIDRARNHHCIGAFISVLVPRSHALAEVKRNLGPALFGERVLVVVLLHARPQLVGFAAHSLQQTEHLVAMRMLGVDVEAERGAADRVVGGRSRRAAPQLEAD